MRTVGRWRSLLTIWDVTAAAALGVPGNRLGAEHEPGRVRRRDDDVNRGEGGFDLRTIGLAVRNERDRRATAAQVARRLLAHLPGAEEEDRTAVERSENL